MDVQAFLSTHHLVIVIGQLISLFLLLQVIFSLQIKLPKEKSELYGLKKLPERLHGMNNFDNKVSKLIL
jgi:hypothetical protein